GRRACLRCVGLTFYLDLMVPIRGRPPIFQRRGSFFFISPSPKLISNYTNHLAQTPNEEIRRSSWVRVFLQPGHAGVAALARGAGGGKTPGSRAFGCSAYRKSGTAEIHRRGPKMRPTFRSSSA